MSYVWAVLFLSLCLGVLGLHVLSLPANWLLLGLAAAWAYFVGGADMGKGFFLLLFGLAALGEAIEFGLQLLGAKRYGATGKGNLGGILGAIAGAILGAPFFLGLGALLGAAAGAYAGCYFFERNHGREPAEARRAAMGALYGKILGLTAKIGCGGAMFLATARAVWPA